MGHVQDTHNVVQGAQQRETTKNVITPRLVLPSSSDEEEALVFPPVFSLPDQTWETSKDDIAPHLLPLPGRPVSVSERKGSLSLRANASAAFELPSLPVPAAAPT